MCTCDAETQGNIAGGIVLQPKVAISLGITPLMCCIGLTHGLQWTGKRSVLGNFGLGTRLTFSYVSSFMTSGSEATFQVPWQGLSIRDALAKST